MSLNRWLSLGIVLSILGLFLFGIKIAPLLADGQQMVRIRNSLIFDEGGSFDWHPDNTPTWFRNEQQPTPEFFAQIGEALFPDDAILSSFDAALKIARHIHADERAKGGMIASDSKSTYQQMIKSGRGYCADFTQVFTAIAHSIDLPVREWGMSFDNYSGDGHAFNEVFSEKRQKWLFVDSFNGFYVTDLQDTPLSFRELKSLLLSQDRNNVKIVRIEPDTFGFRSNEMALDYYSRGVNQAFLWTGNDIFSYENNKLVQLTSGISRSLEQASAILIGAHPKIMLDLEGADKEALSSLASARNSVIGFAVSGMTLSGLLLVSGLVWRKRRKNQAAPV